MAKPVILAVDDDPQVLRAVERAIPPGTGYRVAFGSYFATKDIGGVVRGCALRVRLPSGDGTRNGG